MAKVLVSIPDELLEALDAAAARRLTTRSAFLRTAIRAQLAKPDPLAIRAAVGRGRAAIARLGAFESEVWIRAERDTHGAAARRR
jgi:metal-responsive CopG/Arc/MetJ family transcriptional regulator